MGRAGAGARAPAENAVDHDEEVVRRVGGDGVAPDIDTDVFLIGVTAGQQPRSNPGGAW